MKDDACICFLQWALPHLHMRWPGFKKVRGQVCKRLGRRLEELQLADLKGYRMYLQNNPLEWHILDSMCRITISRFYRDKGIFNSLRTQIFPNLIKNSLRNKENALSCWCIGAASGEEPYSISLLWELSEIEKKGIELEILATEVDPLMIKRARSGFYPASSIRELPPEIKDTAFDQVNTQFCIKEQYKKCVKFLQQDIRNSQPDSAFHLIFCRNLVYTYFSQELQEEITQQILLRLKPKGLLIIGSHEELPGIIPGLVPWSAGQPIYQRQE
jgi:chemotaxis protein methyltransferase CheR